MGNWNWLTFLKVILFGIVEGITEWLPISSTGHMIILEEALGMESAFGPNGSAFWEFFLVFIQFGAILAVIAVFFKELWPWTRSKTPDDRKKIYWTWLYIVIACLPAAVVGLFLDDLLDTYLYNFITVSVTLIIYGLAFIVIELFLRKAKKEPLINDLSAFTWKTALIIGAAQILSLIPGTSRSGVTILAALLIGCNRETSAKFSFYVSIPIMIGASLFKGFKFFYEGNSMDGSQITYLLVGAVVAFGISLLAIKWLTSFVKNHTFIGFGYYRIALGVLLIVLYLSIPSLRGGEALAAVLPWAQEIKGAIPLSLPLRLHR